MQKICERCGERFDGLPRQKFCKEKCRTGNRSSKKYSARSGILAKDKFIIHNSRKKIIKHIKEKFKEVKNDKKKIK